MELSDSSVDEEDGRGLTPSTVVSQPSGFQSIRREDGLLDRAPVVFIPAIGRVRVASGGHVKTVYLLSTERRDVGFSIDFCGFGA